MLATSTPEIKRMRTEQEERQNKKRGKISGSAKCMKHLFEEKGDKQVPSTSNRFRKKTSTKSNSKASDTNLSKQKQAIKPKQTHRQEHKPSRPTKKSRDPKQRCRNRPTSKARKATTPQQVQPLVIRKPIWLDCQIASGIKFHFILANLFLLNSHNIASFYDIFDRLNVS